MLNIDSLRSDNVTQSLLKSFTLILSSYNRDVTSNFFIVFLTWIIIEN